VPSVETGNLLAQALDHVFTMLVCLTYQA